MSVGSLYQYFPNKESILFRLQLDEWQATSTLLREILKNRQNTPQERLRTAIATFLHSECEEAPIRAALADAAPLFRDAPEATNFRRAALRWLVAFWREVLPGVAPEPRARAGELVMMTVKAIGERISEERKEAAEVEAYASALGDMFCAYIERLRHRT